MIAEIPRITVDGIVYSIEASNNLVSRIDAIIQETPEVACDLGTIKPLIMRARNSNRHRIKNNKKEYVSKCDA